MKKNMANYLLVAALAVLTSQAFTARSILAQSAATRPAAAAGASTVDPPIPLTGSQTTPQVSVPISENSKFEQGQNFVNLPSVFAHQWSLTREVPPESIINRDYVRTRSRIRRLLTLKQAVYIALLNNPAIKASRLNPVSAQENVNMQWAEFDPDSTANIGTIYSSLPISTPIETFDQAPQLTTRQYEWNFALNKILATTNGTLTAQFTNLYENTNNLTQTVNPYYNPLLQLSLSQPLLRNFGWKFATLSVQIAESQQKQSQWQYEQAAEDFVLRVGNDYWNLVRAHENLRVAQEALKFNEDLVRQNKISLRVGTMAPIDVQEAESAAETARANVYTAEANLETARVTLRQDVMLNPEHVFIPEDVEPADAPNPRQELRLDTEASLERAVLYRPELHNMRQAIVTDLLQTKFQENQLLPQVNFQTQFGISNEQGYTVCGPTFGIVAPNCNLAPNPQGGYEVPFQGGYASALSKMFDFSFYNYAFFFSWEMQLDNATAKAALSQARVVYEQQRMQYRDMLSQVITDVESSIANVRADLKRVTATAAATQYAREALHNEQQRFRVGMATTHDLLQFENELVSAEGNEVQTQVDLEQARLQLLHAEGRLLAFFGINFELQDPHTNIPWFGKF
jgi:outer membrane protein TolC